MMKNTSFPRFGTLSRCALMALSIGALAACNSSGTNGNGNGDGGGNGDGPNGNGDGPNGGGPPFTVTVMRAGTGNGSVTSQPAGISCDGTGSCSAMFPGGTTVTLVAQGSGAAFSGWSGACAGQSASCQIAPTTDVTTTASFDPLSCSPDSICWEAPLPFGMDLSGVFAISPTNVWAVGTVGTALNYDGTSWKRVQTNSTLDLLDVWARSATEVWAATANPGGQLLKYNGSSWSAVSTGTAERVTSIFGAGTSNLYAAIATTAVLHSTDNGANWTAKETGNRVGTGHGIGIRGSGANDIWQWDDDCGKAHWNGSTWTAMVRDLTWCPSGIYSTGAADGWAMTSTNGELWHYTSGTNFTKASTITGLSSSSGLWGTSASNMFTSADPGLLYRYDGSAWTKITTSTPEAHLYPKIHGTGPNDIWAVGQRGVIQHFNGNTPTTQRANVFGSDIVSVWGLSTTDLYFVTKGGTLVHYDGTSYKESAPIVTGAGAVLDQISGTAADDLWLAGGSGGQPMLLHNTGNGWQPTTINPAVGMSGDMEISHVFAGSNTVVWASGKGLVDPLYWDGSQWQIDLSITWNYAVQALWGTAANDIWLADGQNVYHNNGTQWSMSSGIAASVYSFGGTGSNDIWAGSDGGVYHFNGTWSTKMAITVAAPGSVGQIVSVSAVGANNVWFTDSKGQVFHYTGAGNFKLINTSIAPVTATPIYSWAANANNVWFAGHYGILSYRN